jgi:replicative DNA helicase
VNYHTNQLPPHSAEAEMLTVGAALQAGRGDSITLAQMLDTLTAADFFMPRHGVIFEAIRDVFERDGSSDAARVLIRLQDLKQDANVGGVNYLEELMHSTPGMAEGPLYAPIVKRHARTRRVVAAAEQAIRTAHGLDADPDAIAEELAKAMGDVMARGARSITEQIGDVTDAVIDDLRQREPCSIAGIKVGFPSLDSALMGLEPGTLTVIAGRPSMGKSAFAMNLAERMARAGDPVGFISLEMPNRQISQRLLSGVSGVPLEKIRLNDFSAADWSDLEEARAAIATLPLLVHYAPAAPASRVRAIARDLVDRHGIKCLFIDYLQIMRASGRVNTENEKLTGIMADLKALAGEMDLPAILLSQFSRDATVGADHPPSMAQLRGSGSIEQDADNVMILHRPGYYTKDPTDTAVWLIVEKNRQGPTCRIQTIDWIGAQARFVDQRDFDSEVTA